MFATVHNEDFLIGIDRIADRSVDLVVADPPYGLGKDYGNDSDQMPMREFLDWNERWIDALYPKLTPTASMYLFTSWRYSPEIFSMVKQRLTQVNEIIWNRLVPSMGGSTRKFSSVHDNIGLFVAGPKYYFDIDSVRIPYDAKTKKARTRKRHAGAKWLEQGRNPTDIWNVARLHRQDPERRDHPTQKPLAIIETMVLCSCPKEGLVLDPFAGTGTTAEAAMMHGRRSISFELNPSYCDVIRERLRPMQIDANSPHLH